MDELMKAIAAIAQQIKNTDAKLSSKIDDLDGKIGALQPQLDELKLNQQKQEERLDQLEKEVRIRNLVFFGVPEQENTYMELEKAILNIVNNNLQTPTNSSEIQHVRRIGKKGENPRPINVGLTTYSKKIAILKNKHKLVQTGLYLKEDFPPKILEVRKQLQVQLKTEIEKGNKAFIKYNKLVVRAPNSPLKTPNKVNHNKRTLNCENGPTTSNGDSIRPVKKNKTHNDNRNITQYLTTQMRENKTNQ